MSEIFVLAEHLRGELRDATFEMLGKARQLAGENGGSVTAVLLGHGVADFATRLAEWADRVLVVEDEQLANFNAEAYQKVLAALIDEHKPALTLIAQSALGMDLAPSLAVELGLPLVTDCVGLHYADSRLLATRQVYGGKVSAEIAFGEAPGYVATVRPGAFPAEDAPGTGGSIVAVPSPLTGAIDYRRFVEYVEAVVGDVDITRADVVVSVGRGIKEADNLPVVQALADALHGVLACSRPVSDAGWLPPDRQVGQSGKTVKPKLYVAVGISGAFQHLAGMSGASTIIAINKDRNAPIFTVADYGIVGDLFEVVPALTAQVKGA